MFNDVAHCRKKLDETTAELKKTSEALEVERKKTELLLYQMLPQKVANDLKNGKQVQAGESVIYHIRTFDWSNNHKNEQTT